MNDTPYLLGHSAAEVRRLELQAELVRPMTKQTLERIGLSEGMRVLDIGTGTGDVAAMAAEFVGPSGHVVGIDRVSDVIERARARFPHVDFELRSLQDIEEASYDLVIGRFVAMHQPDDIAFLRQAARRVAPGGTVAFIDLAVTSRTTSRPTVPLFDETAGWTGRGLEACGARIDLGAHYVERFARAGLPEPSLYQEVPTSGPSSRICEWVALSFASVLPALEKAGLARAADFDLSTLSTRIQEAAKSVDAQLSGPPIVSAWAKLG